MLLVWGLPILLWLLVVVFGWMFCFSSDEEEQAADEAQQVDNNLFHQQRPNDVPQVAQNSNPINMGISQYDFSGAYTDIPGISNMSGCRSGILVDVDRHRVLWAKDADKPVAIASMTKMMTLLLIEEAIAKGSVKRDAMIKVTDAAYRIGGTQVWLDPKESFPLSELTKAIAIRSANDASYLVGEYLASGNINAFVQSMNVRAKELGMKDTHFYDPHGLGNKAKNQHNMSSAYDMILLGERLLYYPEIMKLTSTDTAWFRNGKTRLDNSNNLVRKHKIEGVDGLKTGYTDAAGFCVTFSLKHNGRRFLGCVTGFKKADARDEFCKHLIKWVKETN
jgi:D-alanyl-D-alanine carboxypeptidase (penicillin-binding protein 5/6)